MRGARLGAVGALMLAMLASWPAMGDDATSVRRWVVGEPVTIRNLTIYPLRAPDGAAAAPDGEYLTLDEGIAAKQVTIGETGNVPELQITNDGDRTLFLMAGEMVKGGKQDRIIAANITIAAKSTALVPVFCVEQGRWSHQSDFTSTGGLVHAKLRCVAQESKSQGDVWSEVAGNNGKLGTGNATSTYRATFDDVGVGKLLELYLEPLRAATADPRTTGVCVAISGKVVGGDAYASPRLFSALRDKLLRSYAIDALARLPEAIEAADGASLLLRAMCWSGQGRNEEALADLARAMALEPANAQVPLARARILVSLGRHEEALVACDRAVEAAPLSAEARYARAEVLVDLGALRLAFADLEWLASHGGGADAWAMLGFCYHRLASERDAFACYTRALAIDPEHAASRFNRAIALVRAGERERSKAELVWVRAHAPEYLRYGYGQQMEQGGRWQGPQQDAAQVEQGPSERQIPQRQDSAGSGSAAAAPPADPEAELEAFIALVAKADSPVGTVRPARHAVAEAQASGNALDALAALPVKAAPIAIAEIERILSEAEAMPVAGQEKENYRFESARCLGFGTGADRAKLLHLNWHCK